MDEPPDDRYIDMVQHKHEDVLDEIEETTSDKELEDMTGDEILLSNYSSDEDHTADNKTKEQDTPALMMHTHGHKIDYGH